MATGTKKSGCWPTIAFITWMSSVGYPTLLVVVNRMNMPIRNARSPIRFTINAFLPAAAFIISRYQNPISRYEQRPTPSQPTNSIGRLWPMTSMSIENMNRLRYEKYRAKPRSPRMYPIE